MLKFLGLTCAAGLAALVLSVGMASATPVAINVNNFSFETPEEGNSGASNGVCPTSWTCTPAVSGFSAGVYSPVPTQYPTGVNGLAGIRTVPSDGSARTNLYNPSGGYEALYIASSTTVSQATSAAIANSTTYALNVFIGFRNDIGTTGFATAQIELLAGSTVLATSGTIASPGQGKWAPVTLSYTTTANDIHAGQILGIALVDSSATSTKEVDFDDVTLTYDTSSAGCTAGVACQTPAPEPFTLSLFGAGLAAAAALRRRKARA